MDILEAVSGIHVIYQISCLSPYLVDRKTWSLKRSRLLEIYTIIVILIAVTFISLSIVTEYNFINTNNNVMGKTVDLIQLIGIRISHVASIAEGLIKSKEQAKFYQEVKIIDQIYERSFNVDVNNKKFRRTTIQHGLLIALVYLAAELFILVSIFWYGKNNLLLFRLLHLMPLLICAIRYFQMFTNVRIVKDRFDLLLNVLNRINLLKPQCNRREDVDLKDYDRMIVSPRNNINPKFTLLEAALLKEKNFYVMEYSEIKRLFTVRDVYNRLFDLSQILNCHFGLSMLINVGNNFISITSNCYWIFYNFHDFYLTRNDIFRLATSLAWALPHLLNIVVLAILCEKTVQKAKEMAFVLHGINVDNWNDDHNAVIEQFSLQLLHQKISINAGGFFSIDCPLLYTIVGSITTYLIILIQLHMNDTEVLK